MRIALFCALGLLASGAAVAAPPQCAADAVVQAKKLLAFHVDGDGRAEVESSARVLPPLVNPANKRQKFLVLEVMGYVYKGNYRMRLLYYPIGGECLLMGQEILELASP